MTTVASREDAQRLAQALIQRRLAACAQMSAIESVYEWQGRMQHEAEYRLLLKTTRQRLAALDAALQELHPYELPALVVMSFESSTAFGQWVQEQTQ